MLLPDLSSCVKAWRKGVSGLQIKRTMDIAYQTAWYLCHRIRAVQRGGMIRLQVIPNATKAVLQQFIKNLLPWAFSLAAVHRGIIRSHAPFPSARLSQSSRLSPRYKVKWVTVA